MTKDERKILDELLIKFSKYEDECYEKKYFLEKYDFNIEAQFVEGKRQAFYRCYRDLKSILLELDQKEMEDKE